MASEVTNALSPSRSSSSPLDLDDVAVKRLKENTLWIYLIFKSADSRESFMDSDSESLKGRATLLPLMTQKGSRSCLQIICNLNHLKEVLVIILGTFPGWGPYIESQFVKLAKKTSLE